MNNFALDVREVLAERLRSLNFYEKIQYLANGINREIHIWKLHLNQCQNEQRNPRSFGDFFDCNRAPIGISYNIEMEILQYLLSSSVDFDPNMINWGDLIYDNGVIYVNPSVTQYQPLFPLLRIRSTAQNIIEDLDNIDILRRNRFSRIKRKRKKK